MKQLLTTDAGFTGNVHDREFAHFSEVIRRRVREATENGNRPLFKTRTTFLFSRYLGQFNDAAAEQHHNCHCCRRFIEQFGDLAYVSDNGIVLSAIWGPKDDSLSPMYAAVSEAMARQISGNEIESVFYHDAKILGTPETGPWRHFWAEYNVDWKNTALNANQASAEKTGDYNNIATYLNRTPLTVLQKVVDVLESGTIYGADRVLGQARWLRDLALLRRDKAAARQAINTVWAAVAAAPKGFCHPNTSMLETLVEDFRNGLSFDDAKTRFERKMDPMKYQRPVAAPKEGNIIAAEKLVEQLGVRASFERRFASMEECALIWHSKTSFDSAANRPVDGLFSAVEPRKTHESKNVLRLPNQTMTFAKFREEVLPNADAIEIYVGPSNESYMAITAPVHAHAPNLFHWHNPFGWYFWNFGASPSSFGLLVGWTPVLGITMSPTRWGIADDSYVGPHSNFALFVIEGARETNTNSARLFPGFMKQEYHGIRAVVEKYSQSSPIETNGPSQQAAGRAISDNEKEKSIILSVRRGSVINQIKIDRWN